MDVGLLLRKILNIRKIHVRDGIERVGNGRGLYAAYASSTKRKKQQQCSNTTKYSTCKC